MSLKQSAAARLAEVRREHPLIDRLAVAAGCYKKGDGDQWAAALSYYGFFAVFPSILVGVAGLGFVLRGGTSANIKLQILQAVGSVLPGSQSLLADSLDAISKRAGTIGLLGLVGLLWSVLGAVGTMRKTLDRMFRVEVLGGLKGKLRDARFGALAAVLLISSVTFSSLAAGGSDALLARFGATGAASQVAGSIFTFALTFATDTLLFIVLFSLLPDHRYGWRDVLPGAVLGAIAWTILKVVGGWYVGRSAGNASAAYGVAAATFGLLITINLSARLTLFAAEFAAVSAGAKGAAESNGPAPEDKPGAKPSPVWLAAALALVAGWQRRNR